MNKHYKREPAGARAASFISLFFSGNGGAKFSRKWREARESRQSHENYEARTIRVN